MEPANKTDEELILPEVESFDHSDPTPPAQSGKKSFVFSIVIGAAFVVLLGALLFVIFKPSDNSSEPSADDGNSSEFAVYDSNEFNEAIDLVEDRLSVRDYISVDYYLSKYPLPERMTTAQKYRYYSALAAYYSKEHKNDPILFTEYSALAEENLNLLRKGE